ncbi:hypothetical protein HNR23_004476 [Nocardiopsis mwathae]|uniref:Uncharacterized protein n=1 Tax=Nocardiopsis mwathae TaxID=1472723 RepID=A0A7W9YNM6_9ACTN|nr:hypothetical protein [Nocardiopsis mwathae]
MVVDELLDAILNTKGVASGMGKPFTRKPVAFIRHAYHVRSHPRRLRAQGMLTVAETATELGVHVLVLTMDTLDTEKGAV